MRYPNEIPDIIDLLYHAWIPSPDPRQWPEYLRQDPVRGYGLYCFYQGIALGLQLEAQGDPLVKAVEAVPPDRVLAQVLRPLAGVRAGDPGVIQQVDDVGNLVGITHGLIPPTT